MQSQQRAENGVREVILGYYGDDSKPQQSYDNDSIATVVGDFEGPVHATNLDDLPPDIRAILLAENHRKQTGETKPYTDFLREEDKH